MAEKLIRIACQSPGRWHPPSFEMDPDYVRSWVCVDRVFEEMYEVVLDTPDLFVFRRNTGAVNEVFALYNDEIFQPSEGV